MWRISLICEGIYGVSTNLNLEETWNATLVLNVRENQVDIRAEIYMTSINELEEYNELIEALRYFARTVKNKQSKEHCTIQFHCQGLSYLEGEKPWKTYFNREGIEYIDVTFKEEIV